MTPTSAVAHYTVVAPVFGWYFDSIDGHRGDTATTFTELLFDVVHDYYLVSVSVFTGKEDGGAGSVCFGDDPDFFLFLVGS